MEIKFRLIYCGKPVGFEKWYGGKTAVHEDDLMVEAYPAWLYSVDGKYWNPKPIHHNKKDAFTGLHDKNGREIYEGDILDLDGVGGPVAFREASFCLDTGSKSQLPSALHQDRTRMYTVIGNIHETPAPLEDKK